MTNDSTEPVAFALRWPEIDARLCLSTVFDTEAEAKQYTERCGGPVEIVPLYTHPIAAEAVPPASSAPETVTVGAMHQCRKDDQFSRCVHCGAMAEQLAKPCKHFLALAASSAPGD